MVGSFYSSGGDVMWGRTRLSDAQCLALLRDYSAEARIAFDQGHEAVHAAALMFSRQLREAIAEAGKWKRAGRVYA